MKECIYYIREIGDEECNLIKSMRLKSLRSDPLSFWETLEETERQPDEYWKKLANELNAPCGSRMFVLGDRFNIFGYVYGIKSDAINYRLGGLWVDPVYRGKGYGGMLVDHVIAWVKRQTFVNSLKLWCPDDGTIQFYEIKNFRKLDRKMVNSKDGRVIIEMEYILTQQS